jgi:hypothetical protein
VILFWHPLICWWQGAAAAAPVAEPVETYVLQRQARAAVPDLFRDTPAELQILRRAA